MPTKTVADRPTKLTRTLNAILAMRSSRLSSSNVKTGLSVSLELLGVQVIMSSCLTIGPTFPRPTATGIRQRLLNLLRFLNRASMASLFA